MAAAGEQSACRLRPGALDRTGPAGRGREVRLAVPRRRSGAHRQRRVPSARPARAADPADRAVAAHQPDRADRHRVVDVQRAVQPGAPARVGRPRQRWARRLEHRHLGGSDEAANFGLDDRPDHATRYARADEFLDVAKALWDSWETRCRPRRQGSSGRYADPSRLHAIDHDGRPLQGRGPAQRGAPAAGPPAAGAGGLLGGRQELRRPPRGGHLHRPPDLRARRRLLRRHQGTDEGRGS